MKRLGLGLLFILSLLFTLGACTETGIVKSPVMTGPELATHIASDTVALVTDFGEMDKTHGGFCTAVWVGDRTILTANHCVEGYADMQHKYLVVQAWIKNGVPKMIIPLLLEAGLDDPSDIDPTDPDADKISDATKEVIEIAKSVPPVNPDTVFIPYIIQSAVTDTGVHIESLHYTQVIARSKGDDLAILQTNGKHPNHLTAKLAETSPLVGDQVEVMGHVRHNFWLYRQGNVGAYRSSVEQIPDIHGPFLEITAAIGHGDSGGGVFNPQGELIGILSFIDPGFEGGYCIHLETIRGFLAAQHVVKLKIDTTAKDPDLRHDTLDKW